MKKQHRKTAWAAAMMLAFSSCAAGCSSSDQDKTASQAVSGETQPSSEKETDSIKTSSADTEKDTENASVCHASYDEDDLTPLTQGFDAEINLTGDSASVKGDEKGVSVSGSTISISRGGAYRITGSLTDGQLYITGDEKVRLLLDGVSITNSEGSAIFCDNEKRTIITLADGTVNSLADGEDYSVSDDEPAAALYAKDKLTINGSGTLNVKGCSANGIVSKDDLKFTGGTVNADAVKNGVKGTDSVAVCGGTLNITAGNDGIRSTKSGNDEKGFVSIDGGDINITAGGDGIQAENSVEISAGTLNITTNGEITVNSNENFGGGMMHGGGMVNQFAGGERPDFSENFGGERPQMQDGMERPDMNGERPDFSQGFGGEMPPEMPDGFGGEIPDIPDGMNPFENTDNSSDSTSSDTSSKGLKSGGKMALTGGSITINSTDHCIKSDDAMDIKDTQLSLSSSMAKGISSHGDLTISGEKTGITIEKCTEGIESKSVMNINGGNIRILDASDDGMNAGGNENPEHTININGGTVYINSQGDGVDSNGDLNFNGGIVVVSGPVSGGDGSLDSDGTMYLNGGTVIGLSSRGMMEYPQGCMMTTSVNASEGDMIAVADENGDIVIAVKADKQVTDVIFADGSGDALSGYSLITGGTYEGNLCEDGWAVSGSISGGTKTDWSMTDSASGGFGGGMMQDGNNGGFGGRENMPEGMTPPDGFGGRGGRHDFMQQQENSSYGTA